MKKITVLSLVAGIAVAVQSGPAAGITNGQPDGRRHPQVGALVGFYPPAGRSIAYCTGTLVAPTVFITAAHCGWLGTSVQVTFDEVYSESSRLHPGTLHAHPGFIAGSNAQSHENPDIAVVILDRPVQTRIDAQLPQAGLLDDMKAAGTLDQETLFTFVGYGDSEFTNSPGGKTTTHLQARHFAVGSFHSLTPGYLHLDQTRDGGGTCYGDSGAPNFLGAGSGETPVIAAITTTGDTYCTATNVAYRLDTTTARNFLDDYLTVP